MEYNLIQIMFPKEFRLLKELHAASNTVYVGD